MQDFTLFPEADRDKLERSKFLGEIAGCIVGGLVMIIYFLWKFSFAG